MSNKNKSIYILIIVLVAFLCLGIGITAYILGKNSNINNSNNNVLDENESKENDNKNDEHEYDKKGVIALESDFVEKIVDQETKINGKVSSIQYSQKEEDNDVKQYILKLNGKVIFDVSYITSIKNISWEVFTLGEKEYFIVSFEHFGTQYYIVDENGNILFNKNNYSEEIGCYVTFDGSSLNYKVQGDELYIYSEKEYSYGDLKVVIEEYKVSIIDDEVSITLTGNTYEGTLNQCS